MSALVELIASPTGDAQIQKQQVCTGSKGSDENQAVENPEHSLEAVSYTWSGKLSKEILFNQIK